MNKKSALAACVAVVVLVTANGTAQEKKSTPAPTLLKVTVVLNEYDGNTKVSSLPYVMPCKAVHPHDPSSLRMGFEVPYVGKENEIQYRSVGTNLDCWSEPPDEQDAFMVGLAVEHKLVYTRVNGEMRPGPPSSNVGAPVTGGISASLRDLLLHDGQTINALSATDPVSGHVWKVEVTLNVVK